MKKILYGTCLTFCALALFASCKKDNNTTPDPSNPGGNNNPYYFNFKSNGTAYNFNSNLPQYISSDDNEIGGFQMPNNAFNPSISLSLMFDHKPTSTEVLDLAGHTFYFNDATYPHAVVEYDGGATDGSEQYSSVDTPATNFNVKINTISYVRTDTTIFNIVDVYVVKGTCSAYLESYQTPIRHLNITDGDFNFLISKVK